MLSLSVIGRKGSGPASRIPAVLLASVFLIGTAPSVAHADAPKPVDILNRMQSLYKNASSYVGTNKITQSGTIQDRSGKVQPFVSSMTIQIKYKKPNMLYMRGAVQSSGAAARLNGHKTLFVTNGKAAYQTVYATKTYSKVQVRPLPPLTVILVQGALQVNYDPKSVKMLSTTSVGGRPAYVIQALPDLSKIPPVQRAQIKIKPFVLTIDKSSYQLLKMIPPTSPSPTANVIMVIEMSGQTINGSLSDSAFTFVPPPGAKETAPPPPQGMAPGGPPRR